MRPVLLTLACTLALTLAVWQHSRMEVERHLRVEFEAELAKLRTDLNARLTGNARALRAAVALFNASDEVTSRDWADFVRSLRLEKDFPAMRGMFFARDVDESGLNALLREMRAAGVADFSVRPPGRRERYVINVFMAPEDAGNRRALGYDVWQDAEHRAAMQRARDSGEPAIARLAKLNIDEQGRQMPAFIMYLPVPPRADGSQGGFVLSPFRMPVLMDELFHPARRGIALTIHDGDTRHPDALYYRSHANSPQGQARLTHSESFSFGGRQWRLDFASLPEFDTRVEDGHPQQMLIGGMMFSLLAAFAAWVLSTRRDHALGLARDMTRSLRESEARLRVLIDHAPEPIVVYDADADRFVDANPRAEALFCCPREELLTASAARFYPPGIHGGKTATVLADEMLARAMSGEQALFDRTLCNARGELVRCEMRLVRLPATDRRLVRVSFIDITQRKRIEADLQVAAITFESHEGMLVTDAEKKILRVNRSFCEITGYEAGDAVGQTPRLLKSGRHEPAFYQAMWEAIVGKGTWSGEIWNRRKNGEIFPAWTSITAVRRGDGGISHYVGTFTDITQRRAAEDEIRHLAFYDVLTHLPNRRLMLDRLRQALTASARHGRHGALMLFDLDDFKTLNDTLGHDVGDQFLIEVAARLESCIRECDTVARLGGDEFVVILEELDAGLLAAMQAESVAVKIQGALNQPYLLDLSLAGGEANTRSYHCTSSIGITLFRDHDVAVEELLKRADTAMYQAKAAGRNTLRFFDPQMQAAVSARATLDTDLRAAIAESQFALHYQPQVDGSGRMTGVEALLRWLHPRRGLVMPAEFIDQAESTRLIMPLGRWVLETACHQLAAWARQPGRERLDIAVNVSSRQFHQADFVDQVKAVLAATGADPRRLKLEVTESLLLHDIEDVVARMTQLRALGISFALDDFGTGYSSLYYLKRLPLAQLKIDQSFVRDVLSDANDAAIARTVIALGQNLGLAVIAEGVETAGQRDFLMVHGCHAFQGNLFGVACGAEELFPGPAAEPREA
ncbi:MAG: EAL domain-containing protein [Rhodocyclales bacterium]|nr:EAL domain-containing protein [Rhodocyclales bacterium]